VHLVALTGGIASGKSTISRRLAEHGAVVIDADKVAREVVEPGTPALERIVERFGAGVLNDDGSLNRSALGSIVFSDDAGRLALNAITHPAVWTRTKQLIQSAAAADESAVIVYDVPLLIEASKDRPISFDQIVVVEAPAATRLRRLVELRGMTEAEASSRVSAQASDEERRRVADTVISTDGTLEETLQRTDDLWDELSRRARVSASS
jgi:dephospho-CoA kinase